MEDYPLVAVVVAVHNNKELTRDFLECFRQVTYPNYKIIMVDDGSTDGTEEMVKREYPEVLVLKGDGTLWQARSYNWGVEQAREIGADYVLHMDNDTTFEPGFLSALVDTAQHNPGNIVTSKLYYWSQPNKLIDAGVAWNYLKGGYRARGYDKIDEGQYDEPAYVEFGCMGFLIKTSFFEDLIGADSENFPQWRWEGDLILRARGKGYRVIYQPRSKIWHKVSRTARTGIYTSRRFISAPLSTLLFAFSKKSRGGPLSFRELMRFYLRHYPIWYIPFALLCDGIGRILNEIKGKR